MINKSNWSTDWNVKNIILLPSSVCAEKQQVLGFMQSYRGWRWEDDISDGGFELVDIGSILMSTIIGLNRFDLHVELPGLVFVLWIAGRIEGIVFGMWADTLRKINIKWMMRRGKGVSFESCLRLRSSPPGWSKPSVGAAHKGYHSH